MKREDYIPTMRRLAALFPQREISAETIAAYFDMLTDLDADVFRLAARQCAVTCDWFPTVAQLRREAQAITAEQHGLLSPAEAWMHVLDVARHWTERSSATRQQCDHRTFAALQSIGGIREVATTEAVGLSRLERQFRAAYERAYQADVEVAMTRRLPTPEADTPALVSGGRG